MIVSKLPRIAHAARNIAAPLFILFLWDVAVTIFYLKVPTHMRTLELPLSLFGTAIALFIGFAVNASYARWWEARGLWGMMITASRNVARQALTFADGTKPGLAPDLARDFAHDVSRSQIALVHLLRTSLRGEPVPAEFRTYLPASLAAPGSVPPTPTMILTHMGRLAARALAAGLIDPYARVRIETTLVDITSAQGGMDRIKNTPLPSQYRFFPTLFARVFCVLLPFAVVDDLRAFTPVGSALVGMMFLMAVQIGNDLMDPFAGDIHDVPMTAMCRTIEIDLLQMIGEPTPGKITPTDDVLW